MFLLLADRVLKLLALLSCSEDCADEGLFLINHALLVKHHVCCHTHVYDLAWAAAGGVVFQNRCYCLRQARLLGRNGAALHLSHLFSIFLLVRGILATHLAIHRTASVCGIFTAYLHTKVLFLVIPALLLLFKAERSGVVLV